VRVLAEVHRTDGYPVNWPAKPEPWLSAGVQLGTWVAELGERVVGHVGLSLAGEGDLAAALWSRQRGSTPDRTAVVGRLFVSPAARGHRIGARLMEQAIAEARRHGLHPVLDVVSSNTAATALYGRLGWERLGTVEQQWGTLPVTIHCYAAPS